MAKLKLLVELGYGDWRDSMKDEQQAWFLNTVLLDGELVLHSNDLGYEVGTVRVLKVWSE